MSDYQKALQSKLVEEKHITESSAKQYIRCLVIANCNTPFSSLDFLKNKKKVEKCLEPYKLNTKKSILTAIVSIAKHLKMVAIYDHYYKKLMELMPKEESTGEKTDTEKANWIDWNAVMEKHKEMGSHLKSWNDRLRYMLLSLYVLSPPRRNLDYLAMYVVPKKTATMEKDKNYLLLKENQFVFNRYKTGNAYGQQVLDIPADLRRIIDDYLSHSPAKTTGEYPFLVNVNGTKYTTSGAITKILNVVFGKKVGASMLRHSYLSHKYNLKEMKQDAEAMAHSVNQQRDYLRTE
jgi:hypothetical protein